MNVIQNPLALPSPWNEAIPGATVSVRTAPGCFTKTTVAKPVQVINGVMHIKPCGLPWTPVADCVIHGLPNGGAQNATS